VPSFIEITPLSTEILRHADYMLMDNGRTDGIPKNVMAIAAYRWQRRHKIRSLERFLCSESAYKLLL